MIRYKPNNRIRTQLLVEIMKSTKVPELMAWLESGTRIIDYPRNFSFQEVISLVEIAEIEMGDDKELLDQKIEEFKK